MKPGDVVEGRFEIERMTGSGGMGTVFRARDRQRGVAVALKTMRAGDGPTEARFEREARVLAVLSHPGIVRYVAHGAVAPGGAYLVMEWLEGEDLSARLARGRLTVDESVTLAAHVADALGAAHALGVVHRDLKPTNLFLVRGDVAQVKVLDFGVAWLGGGARVTQGGALVGTPGYMAPEQARSGQVALGDGDAGRARLLAPDVAGPVGDARVTQTGTLVGTPGGMAPERARSAEPIAAPVDVFSLGCVLFECLTGVRAFAGEHFMAVLAKILLQEVPSALSLCPEVPADLDALLAQMLSKAPGRRPADGAAVARALAPFHKAAHRGAPPYSASPGELTGGELRALSIVVIGRPSLASTRTTALDTHPMMPWSDLRRTAESCGGRFELLTDGSVVVTLATARVATDQAAQAARCALLLREHAVGLPMALVTARAELTGRNPVGDAIDQAWTMLAHSTRAAAAPPGSVPVAIDTVTAGLLDARFEVRESEGGLWIHREHEIALEARTLLGKPTRCVGRDVELATLEQTFVQCVEKSVAQVVVVTGAAGIGKSRLAFELMHRLRVHGEPVPGGDKGGTPAFASRRPISIWIARGDPIRAASPFGLLGQALRGAFDIRGGEPLDVRRKKLRAEVDARVADREGERVAEFLGEILGTPMPDDDSARLRAARSNPRLMGEQTRRAWEDIVAAELSVRPLLLVLEDLHWGDLPTIRLIDGALGNVKDRPWMVLALARPEVHALFPKLWAERNVQEIRVQELTRKASERLARQALGDDVSVEAVHHVVAQAAGNAFYLEELIRAKAEGREDAVPETVLAMVQSRLEGLGGAARQALRAASVFGGVFWPGSVSALLGQGSTSAQVRDRMEALVDRELLVRHRGSRFLGEQEFAFRHALLREGAYAMLTEDDRAIGHRLAGAWLEQAGERDPKVLAEHFDLGAMHERAATHYLRAAEQALDGVDCQTAIKLSMRGIALGREPELIAGLRATEGEARFFSGDFQGAVRATGEALALARPGSRTEGKALYSGTLGALYLRDAEMLRWPMERLLHTDPRPDAVPLLAAAMFSVTLSLAYMTQRDTAERYLRRLEQVTADVMDRDPIATAWVELTRSMWAAHVERDFWAFLEHARKAASHYERSGAGGLFPFAHVYQGIGYSFLGLFDRAEEEFSRVLATVPATGPQAMTVGVSRSVMYLNQGRHEAARASAAWVVEEAEPRGEQLMRLLGRLALADAMLYKGAIEAAESEALAVTHAAAAEPLLGMWYLAILACIRLAQGRAAEAGEIAERGHARSRACRMGYCMGHAKLLLVRAEALRALGDHRAACQAIREAQEDLLRSAVKIPDPEVRRSFLENILIHRRTLTLARQWLRERESKPSGS